MLCKIKDILIKIYFKFVKYKGISHCDKCGTILIIKNNNPYCVKCRG